MAASASPKQSASLTIIVYISGNDMAISGVVKTWLSLSAASAERRGSIQTFGVHADI